MSVTLWEAEAPKLIFKEGWAFPAEKGEKVLPEACGKHEQASMDCRVPWGETGDGVGKERKDCLGSGMLGWRPLSFCQEKKKKRETWGRGLKQEQSVVQVHDWYSLASCLVCFPSLARSWWGRGIKRQCSPKRLARSLDLSQDLFPPRQAPSPSSGTQTNSSTAHDKEAHLEPGQDLQTSTL